MGGSNRVKEVEFPFLFDATQMVARTKQHAQAFLTQPHYGVFVEPILE
ncbi:hypothetical protein A2U01_0050185, partial [Trifolium medium]|nr:hypothetical protein [Trifolium medium]